MCPNTRIKSKSDLTPLALAWQYNNREGAKMLLQFGARVNGTLAWEGMGNDNTLLHLVCSTREHQQEQDTFWINLLGRHGANPDPVNSLGLTPMHYALHIFNTNKIRALAEIGASCSRIYRKRPVLHMAAIKHSALLVEDLIEAGTSIDCRDEKGRTVLHYANRFRSVRVLEKSCHSGPIPMQPTRTVTAPCIRLPQIWTGISCIRCFSIPFWQPEHGSTQGTGWARPCFTSFRTIRFQKLPPGLPD